MLIVPTNAVPSQTLSVSLAEQACAIAIYQKGLNLFMDLSVSGRPIFSGQLCLDRVKLVRQKYLGFAGDLFFFDTQGKTDPVFTGLNRRYLLAYATAEEVQWG